MYTDICCANHDIAPLSLVSPGMIIRSHVISFECTLSHILCWLFAVIHAESNAVNIDDDIMLGFIMQFRRILDEKYDWDILLG